MSIAAALSTLLSAGQLCAFPHVVQVGESAASVAERVYGRVDLERIIIAANRLDGLSGSQLVAGMWLDVPAVSHHQVAPGETWSSMAAQLLGAADRGVFLAQQNGAEPWLQPAPGREVVLPYNLRYVVSAGDTTDALAYRFLGRRDRAWMIAVYNGLKDGSLHHGDVLLIPLVELELTDAGKREAADAGALVRTQGAGEVRAAQQRADAEMPLLVADVRHGHYVAAVARGAALLGAGMLSKRQVADVTRQLTEAYVALGATGLAATACAQWRLADPSSTLDPLLVSPKIIRACAGAADPGIAPFASAAPRAAAPGQAGEVAPGAAAKP